MPYIKCNRDGCENKTYSYPSDDKRGKYCSRRCFLLSKRKIVECSKCGKKFSKPKWRIEKNKTGHHFCSKNCYHKFSKGSNFNNPPTKGNNKDRKIDIPKKTLKDLYVEKKLTITEVAEKIGCSRSTVNRRLKENNINRRRAKDYRENNSESHLRRKIQNKPCKKCGWNKDVCDVAHLKPKKDGGEYKESNLIPLCPNCHRLFDKGKLKI